MNAPDMTLRDWFAGQALAGLMANTQCPTAPWAETAYRVADAMLDERAKGKLTITISAASMGSGSDVLTLATKYEASHTDKDGDSLDAVTVDPRQKEIEL